MAKVEVQNKKRRQLTGVVVNVSDSRTVKVLVEEKFPHSKYGKIVKTHKSYIADKAADLELQPGNEVIIEEAKPISKRKTWKLVKVTKNVIID